MSKRKIVVEGIESEFQLRVVGIVAVTVDAVLLVDLFAVEVLYTLT